MNIEKVHELGEKIKKSASYANNGVKPFLNFHSYSYESTFSHDTTTHKKFECLQFQM